MARINDLPLPPGMYKGGFRDTDKVVSLAIEQFGLEPPITLYYPGSSTDISLTGIEGVDGIHVDQLLNDEAIDGFRALGATAVKEDVHYWSPPKPVEVVAFINPSGIDIHKVLDQTKLAAGGLVLWASTRLPHALQEYSGITLKAVIKTDEKDALFVDTQGLDDYFVSKRYEELSTDEVEEFRERLDRYLARHSLSDPRTLDETYRLLQLPENRMIADEVHFYFPYKKEGSYFIYQR
jgi:hypothetical protein